MPESRLHINVGKSLAGLGLSPVLPPFALSPYASYMFGGAASAFAADPAAEAYGPLYDWSGNGRHLSTVGAYAISDWHVTSSSSTDAPTTTFNLNDLVAANGACSVVVFSRSGLNAKPVSLARSGSVDPLLQLSLFPANDVFRNTMTPGTASRAEVSAIPDATITGVSLYGAGQNATNRTAWVRGAAGNTLSAINATATALNSTGDFQFGVEASSGDANATFIYGAAFYDTYLSEADMVEIQRVFRAWHSGVSSGVVV